MNGFVSATDLYNEDAYVVSKASGESETVSTKVAEHGAVRSGAAMFWLLLVVMFVLFGILYKASELSE